MSRLESLEGDRAKTNKEVLNDTVHNAPVVKEVAIGVIGRWREVVNTNKITLH